MQDVCHNVLPDSANAADDSFEFLSSCGRIAPKGGKPRRPGEWARNGPSGRDELRVRDVVIFGGRPLRRRQMLKEAPRRVEPYGHGLINIKLRRFNIEQVIDSPGVLL